jgi:outer membrane receptor protein involved in Fe transport
MLSGLAVLFVAAASAAEPAAGNASQEIVVTARKDEVESHLDRTTYDVTTDVQSTTGTLSDVLTAIPSVDIDSDGTLSLRGDSHVIILIDGKPSALFAGASAGENLDSIPARDIVRVEVMNNPPPQYKADGAAGVINIITRRHRSVGLAGSVQGTFGSEGRYEAGANASYGTGPLNVALSATFRHDLRHGLIVSDLLTPSAANAATDTHSVIDQLLRRNVPPVDLAIDYAVDERQSLRLEVQRTGRGGLRTYTETSDTTALPATVTESSQRLSYGHDHEVDFDNKLIYSRKLSSPGETLDFTLHRATSENKEHYDYTNQSWIPPGEPYLSDLGFREDTATTEATLDYNLPLSSGRTLKLGYGFEQDGYGYASSGGSIDAGGELVDPNLVDDFQYLLQIHSLYASYELTHGSWQWLLGMRGEIAATDGRQLTQAVSNDYRYARLYPSVHAERQLSEESKLTFAASRRVTRPHDDALNPYVDHEFTPDLRAGNALLRPQYTASFEAGVEHDAHGRGYSVGVYHRQNTGTVTDVVQDLGGGFTLTTKANLPRDSASGMDFSVRTRLTALLNLSLSADLFRRQIDATALGGNGLESTTGINGKLRMDFRPTSADSVQVLIARTDRALTPQGTVSAVNIVNAGYRHELASDMTAFVTVSDAFNGQHTVRTAITPQFTQFYQRASFGRIVWVGMTYAFGSSKSDADFEYAQPEQ